MTVLEAMQESLVLPLILADKLGVGRDVIDRLLGNMEFISGTGCWLWKKATRGGYGVIHLRKPNLGCPTVHRLCHQLAYGPIPDDRHVHHKVEDGCMGRVCANPEHTAAVTPAEHVVELTPGSASNIAAHRECCAMGHPYTEENTRRDSVGRRCRACERRYAQESRDRKRGTRPKFRWHTEKRRKVCKRGHLVAGDNAYWQSTPRGLYATCLECKRAKTLEWQRNKRKRPVS